MNVKQISTALVIFCFLTLSVVKAQSVTDSVVNASAGPSCKSLAIIAKLHPVVLTTHKHAAALAMPHTGSNVYFNMDEVRSVCPYLVKTEVKNVRWGKNSYRTVTVESIDMQRLAMLLFSAVQELQQLVKPGYSGL